MSNKNMPRMRNTKCYGMQLMQATTIEGQNAFAPTLCFALVLCYRWSRHGWPNCVLCIPFILSGSPNESWLHTCDECVITIWRLGCGLLLSPAIIYKLLLWLFSHSFSKGQWSLAPVVKKLNSTIHPADKYLGNQLRFPLDRDLSIG